jgi:hypothetical protein
MLDDSQFLYSSLREKILEHLFVGELLRYVPSGVASAPVTDPARDLAMMR